ncbi:McrB family protein [Pseudovibrio sp. JE062]|uniref:McrB family protein n=1 Tax=Pseudovibrio sp. JE062 TaxID=439495 RepID=UPI00055E6F2E|nr:hypothetical protein [Pseudovibrio sp. JE062]
MNKSERQVLYRKALETDPSATPNTSFRDAFGVSNSAKIIPNGLFCFNVNLNSLSSETDQIVVHCLLLFPPDDEIYFSIFIKNGMRELRARLDEMASAGTSKPHKKSGLNFEGAGVSNTSSEDNPRLSPDDLNYTDNNKNVKGYLARDGRLYFRNKGFFDEMPEDLHSISRPVDIEKIVFAVYPPEAAARRSLLAREFVGYLGNLIGRDRIHEVRNIWPEANAVSPEMARMPNTLELTEIKAAVSDLGGYYPNGELTRYHAGLNFLPTKHFVILSGLSGTGKTQLATLYARAIHGKNTRDAVDPFLFVCPVRPEWTDPSGLTGYYDVISDRYVVPPFLEAVLIATAFRDSPVFVILDEMNLARVEYYFSDVLSAMETGEALPLHSNGVPLEGTTGSSIPASIPLPSNLFISGTINIDETTNPVSDKVLDRAILIEMNDIDVSGYLKELEIQEPSLSDACKHCGQYLIEMQSIMARHRLGFGYRLIREVVLYHSFSVGKLGQDRNDVLDEMTVQKILVKLKGSEAQRALLKDLSKLTVNLPQATSLLEQLIADLDEYGSFQTSR